MTPDVCPHCGAAVPRDASACPECGADAQTGWSDSGSTGDLGLPDEEFDYDGFVREEFGGRAVKPRGISWWWWAVGLALVAAFLWWNLR